MEGANYDADKKAYFSVFSSLYGAEGVFLISGI